MPWYDSAKDALLEAYTTGNSPVSGEVSVGVVGVDNTYVFDADHSTVEDLGDSVVLSEQLIANLDITGGVFSGDDVVYDHPSSVGLTAVGVVIYFTWSGGTQLLSYNAASTDGTFPFTILPSIATIEWPTQGIMKL